MMAALIACAGIAVPAVAQDSVSNNPSPQAAGDSDALSPWVAGNQDVSYILNLTPFTSSWGTSFATAPLAKSSRSSTAFESSLLGAQAISRGVISGGSADLFKAWNVSGEGVNATENDPTGTASAPMNMKQFGFAFSEFATSDTLSNVSDVIGGVANIFPNNSCKLYVNRVVAVTNSADGTTNSAALNIGAVDAKGNIAVRADDFGALGPDPVLGNNIVIIDTQARSGGIVNKLSRPAGVLTGADAAATLFTGITSNGFVHSTPNLIPASSGGPSYIGTNFNSEYVFNNGASSTLAHLSGLPDQRGTLAYSNVPLLGGANAVGAAGTLARDAGGVQTRAFAIWDVDSTGAIVGTPATYTPPLGADDPCYTTDDATWNPGFTEFDHYHSQIPFNGGNSQLALGQDQNGALLAAGIVYNNGTLLDTNLDPTNGILVLRDKTPGVPGDEEWSLAAWNGGLNNVFTPAGRGKPVLDGPGGAEIGFISTSLEASNGLFQGVSLSGCTIDSVGNIWFLAPVEYPSNLAVVDPTEIHTTLLRAVYNDMGGANGEPCWELEAIMKSGDIFSGANSGADFLVGFIGIADGNSVASGTLWSQNSTQDAYAGMSTLGMATSDARSTGGVLLSTSIVYDTDGDGMFSFNSDLAADDDEAYNVIMYIGANLNPCPDINADGIVDSADLGSVISQFGTAGASADFNCDGVVDSADLGTLISQFGTNCGN